MGTKPDAAGIVLKGLKKLEYRGYDSWGIAVPTDADISTYKRVGAIGTIEGVDLPDANVAIGHTRWATHGGVTDINAHPHYSSDKSFVLAQNGIVENYEALKTRLLKKGYKFQTQTDTEVIVRLIEDKFAETKSLEEAISRAFLELKGRNTVIILTKDGEVIGARNGSPLVIGTNRAGDVFFSSDTLSFANEADDVFVVDNGVMVVGRTGQIKAVDIKNGSEREVKFEKSGILGQSAEKEGFAHFMLKEIFESPDVIRVLTSKQNKQSYLEFARAVKKAGQVYTIGSGTAGVAAAQIAYFLRAIGKIDAVSLVGADAFEYLDLMGNGDLIIAPSQSGETADVLEVLEEAKTKGVKIASFVNMPGSMMTKMSDFAFMAAAGPEIAVVSTKVFTSQISWGYLISKAVCGEYADGAMNLEKLAVEIEKYLNNKKKIEKIKGIAKTLISKKDIFLLAKAQNYQMIREGMVKIIEASYKHAHAMPAGDLKHYAITLMENGVPVIVVISNDEVKTDVLSAVSQVSARGAEVFGIAPFNFRDFRKLIEVPDMGEVSAIFNVIVLQLLGYYMGVLIGNNVDRPRNIAKSVTVK